MNKAFTDNLVIILSIILFVDNLVIILFDNSYYQ